jgi:hypothetical protein
VPSGNIFFFWDFDLDDKVWIYVLFSKGLGGVAHFSSYYIVYFLLLFIEELLLLVSFLFFHQ